jgi:hypothetical protein
MVTVMLLWSKFWKIVMRSMGQKMVTLSFERIRLLIVSMLFLLRVTTFTPVAHKPHNRICFNFELYINFTMSLISHNDLHV